MWLSKQVIRKETQPQLENGKVTLSSNGALETVSSGVDRSLVHYAPFGYSYCAPLGENMLLTQLQGETAAVGVEMKKENVASGEIKLTSKSGAYIHLKNDGSVIINGLVINRRGEIEDD